MENFDELKKQKESMAGRGDLGGISASNMRAANYADCAGTVGYGPRTLRERLGERLCKVRAEAKENSEQVCNLTRLAELIDRNPEVAEMLELWTATKGLL